jgi:hypothetical protein
MTAPPPYFAPLSVDGTVYDLGHLDPLRFQVESEKLRRSVTIQCRFSNHVFTRAFDPQVDPADTPFIMDGIRPRVFCPSRYRLSVHLPRAIFGLREPRVYVRQTQARRNWLYVATIEVASDAAEPRENADNATNLARVRYQVFFVLRKGNKSGAPPMDVEMVVESAYADNPARPQELLGRALFAGLATAAVEGRPVHTQPARKK